MRTILSLTAVLALAGTGKACDAVVAQFVQPVYAQAFVAAPVVHAQPVFAQAFVQSYAVPVVQQQVVVQKQVVQRVVQKQVVQQVRQRQVIRQRSVTRIR